MNRYVVLLYQVVLKSILSFVVVLAIGQFQIMYQIRYSEDIDIISGFPYQFYFFAKNCQFDLHGFNIYNFGKDFFIMLALILVVDWILKKVMDSVTSGGR